MQQKTLTLRSGLSSASPMRVPGTLAPGKTLHFRSYFPAEYSHPPFLFQVFGTNGTRVLRFTDLAQQRTATRGRNSPPSEAMVLHRCDCFAPSLQRPSSPELPACVIASWFSVTCWMVFCDHFSENWSFAVNVTAQVSAQDLRKGSSC